MNIEKFAESLKQHFGSDVGFPADFVDAVATDRGSLMLRIGDRDIEIDPDGNVYGSGSNVLKLWTVQVLNAEATKPVPVEPEPEPAS